MNLTQEAKTILDQRGEQWGDFEQFVSELYALKNDFRILLIDLGDLGKYFHLKCFIYEMLCLKLTRGIIVTRSLGRFDISDSRLKDCVLDFINYCVLMREIVPFRLTHKTLNTENDWERFFERVVARIALGGDDETES